jgi:hypothetical protein
MSEIMSQTRCESDIEFTYYREVGASRDEGRGSSDLLEVVGVNDITKG